MNRIRNFVQVLAILFIIKCTPYLSAQENNPLKVAVIGLTHTHVHWILGREDIGDIEIIAIVEPNTDLARRYAEQHGYDMNIVYDNSKEMLAKHRPDAVCAFNSIYEHLEVVETFAPLGIHIMVEKPLAVSLDHALKMDSIVKEHRVHLLTNYETTWYPSNHRAYAMLQNDSLGTLRKLVIHDGHQGPIEIGINEEFLEWLIDPEKNGAGALTDFGCYGANLSTWLSKGERPLAVMAMCNTNKPELYPKVDDEATIVVQYKNHQSIIQASWNWPTNRKDLEVYGSVGYTMADNRNTLRYRLHEDLDEERLKLPERDSPFNDPFSLLEAVVRGKITLDPYDLNALDNNLMVMEILQAAMESVASGQKIMLH